MPRALRRALIVVLVAAAARAGQAATLEERFEHSYPLQPGGTFALGNSTATSRSPPGTAPRST